MLHMKCILWNAFAIVGTWIAFAFFSQPQIFLIDSRFLLENQLYKMNSILYIFKEATDDCTEPWSLPH